MEEPKNRSERRARARGRKGGSGLAVSFSSSGRMPDPFRDPILDYAAKMCSENKKAEVLRSKQVKGY